MKEAIHLLDKLHHGGAESVALAYAETCKQWNIHSTLVGQNLSSDYERNILKHASVSHRFTLKVTRNADYIFIHSNRNLLKVLLLRIFLRNRRQQIIYLQHLSYPKWKFRILARIINRVCTDFVRITPLTKTQIERHIRIKKHFIVNFHIERYTKKERPSIRQQVRQELGIPDQATVVTFSGIWRPGKGIGDFLQLAREMNGDPKYIFLLVGDGPERETASAYTGNNLIRTGFVNDVERYLIASDIYCFLSRQEMMPMALIEAIQSGLAVLAYTHQVSRFLLDGNTFDSIGEISQAIRSMTAPKAISQFGKTYGQEKIGQLLHRRRKKILHIQILSKMTGVQRISLEILRSLPDSEYDKYIMFSKKSAGSYTKECLALFSEAGCKVILCDHLQREIFRSDWKAFSEIFRLCRRERFDIVHTHSTKPGIIGRIAARLAGVPLVVHTVHGIAFHRYEKPLRRIYYYLLELFASLFSHRITLVSGFYRRYFRMFDTKTHMIYNGIGFSKLPQKEYIPTPEGTCRLLFVGRLDEQKDPMTLLRAMECIVYKHHRRNIVLTMVGDGSLEETCTSYIYDHGLSPYIKMEGWQSNVAPYYMKHDIFCLSSTFESFGLCFLEAGFYGLSTVATRVEGIPEVVQEGVTGFLVPERNPTAMAEKILLLADNPELRKRMGKAARTWVTEHFAQERMTIKYKQIYTNRI